MPNPLQLKDLVNQLNSHGNTIKARRARLDDLVAADLDQLQAVYKNLPA